MNPTVYDVVIVGGGVAGCYSAWRLSQDSSFRHLCLMEASERIGGRLYSVSLPDECSTPAEMGGMFFTDSHLNVIGLVCSLKLKREACFKRCNDDSLYYVRGIRYKNRDFERGFDAYNLRPTEMGKNPEELLLMAIFQAFPEIAKLDLSSAEEFLKEAHYKGKPIWQWGFWNFLMNNLSQEAIHLIDDCLGIMTAATDVNAHMAILHELKCSGYLNKFHKLTEGYDALPKQMAQKFVENGGELKKQTSLISLKTKSIRGETLIELRYKNREKTAHSLAKKVILALPKRALETIEEKSPIFSNTDFRQNLQRVSSKQASKVFMWFDKEWWSPLSLSHAISYTDLPIRQCIYWAVEKRKGILLASFNDGESVKFWEKFLDQSASTEREFRGAKPLSDDMIEEVLTQLTEMHGVDIPKPAASLFVDWKEDPYGGGWHFWNPHNEVSKLVPKMRHPVKDMNLYIAGEAYSAYQGWVEGAINSAEKVLQDHFGLNRAPWLKASYDLGP